MKLTILGSSSSGNGYVLQNKDEALVLECGTMVSDCLQALDWNSKKVRGCLLTHEHGDHAKYVDRYLQHFTVYTSKGTASAIEYRGSLRPVEVEALKVLQLGGFSVCPIEAHHGNTNEPLAYIISHAEFGTMLFATDTRYIDYTIPGLTNLLVECNYSQQILLENLKAGRVNEEQRLRTLEHMSIRALEELLDANDLTQVSQIVLIHLSERNSQREAFVREIAAHTGKHTIAAEKGLTIEINKQPF